MVVILVGGHVVVHHLLIGGAHEAGQQRGDEARAVLALVAVDQIRTLVGREEAQAVRKAGLEVRRGEVHAKAQRLHAAGLVQGLIVGGVEALLGEVALDLLGGVGQIQDGADVVFLGERVGVGRAADLVVHRAAAAEQGVFAQRAEGDGPEVGEDLVGGIVAALVGADKLVDQVLIPVAALLLHGDAHGDVLQLPAAGHRPCHRAVLRLVLHGHAVGGGEVAHVDGEDQRPVVVPQDQLAGVHVGIVGAEGCLVFLSVHGDSQHVAVGIAAAGQLFGGDVQHEVAVLLDLGDAAGRGREVRSAHGQRQYQGQRQREEHAQGLFHVLSSLVNDGNSIPHPGGKEQEKLSFPQFFRRAVIHRRSATCMSRSI